MVSTGIQYEFLRYREFDSRNIPKHERGNLDNLLDELHKDGFIEYHKGKDCVSINRYHKDKVRRYLDDEVPEFYWDNW